NDFNRFGRTYKVTAQADAPHRMQAEAIGRLQVRNAAGARLTLRSLGDVEPAGLLARRADIAAAERTVAAATARLGVETAGLYPQVEVRGSIGLVAGNLDALAESGTSFNVLNPVIRWALLDRGRVRARITASEARAQEALILY
ncbi:TolC family protein, partial [Xanthomonas citri pv. citri]